MTLFTNKTFICLRILIISLLFIIINLTIEEREIIKSKLFIFIYQFCRFLFSVIFLQNKSSPGVYKNKCKTSESIYFLALLAILLSFPPQMVEYCEFISLGVKTD